MKKVLVAYFSCSGVTRKLAKRWREQLKANFMKLNRRSPIPQQI